MRIQVTFILFIFFIAGPALAANEKNPLNVVVEGTADVAVQNTVAVEVQNTLDVNVLNTAPVEIDELPAVQIAPGQDVGVIEPVFEAGDILILQSFLATTSAETETITIPKDMILRTITIVPAGTSTDPNLVNCGASIRWPLNGPIDPASTDRYIVSHRWKGLNQISLNYPMPYQLFLPQGSEIDTNLGRIGASGFCQAIVNLTGTTL